MNARPRRPWAPVAIAAAAALGVAWAGGMATELGPWYQQLHKPDWQPPGWLFAPAWTLIFGLTALAAAQAWRQARSTVERRRVVALFSANAVLNILWSVLFFHLHRPDWALAEVALLWLSILAPILLLARPARWLLVPYLAWVSFAAWLNWTVVSLNAPFA